jgi:Polyketide cyclase / dehydrase and lipid transport
MEINSNAPIISCHELRISAPLETVWRVHTQIDSWPDWNPDIAKATLTGPLAVGTVFHWKLREWQFLRRLAKLWASEKSPGAARLEAFLASMCGTFRYPPKAHMFVRKNHGKEFLFPGNQRYPRCAGRVSRPVAFIPEGPR